MNVSVQPTGGPSRRWTCPSSRRTGRPAYGRLRRVVGRAVQFDDWPVQPIVISVQWRGAVQTTGVSSKLWTPPSRRRAGRQGVLRYYKTPGGPSRRREGRLGVGRAVQATGGPSSCKPYICASPRYFAAHLGLSCADGALPSWIGNSPCSRARVLAEGLRIASRRGAFFEISSLKP